MSTVTLVKQGGNPTFTSLTVTGTTNLENLKVDSLNVSGSIFASGSLVVSGSITAQSLIVNGPTNLSGSLYTRSNLNVSGSIFASGSLVVSGSIIAQSLVVNTTIYSSGSNIFGNSLSNTHVFSGSVTMNPGGLFVSSSGLVGIGTTTPNKPLEIYRAAQDISIRLNDSSHYWDVTHGTTNNQLSFLYDTSERMRITSAGSVSIGPATGNTGAPGTTKLQVVGQIACGENTDGTATIDAYSTFAYYGNNGTTYAIRIGPSGLVYNYSNSTTFNTTSDVRIKENINTISNALDKITALNPVTFDYKQDFATHRSWNNTQKNNNIGFIAQEFETVFPKHVYSIKETINEEVIEDFKTVDTGHLVAYLVKAIQELKTELDEATTRIIALESK
jgi:cytoskeletal protein CcmA (bactofilin family)